MNLSVELLERQDCLLLLVDYQKSMLTHCVSMDRILNNTSVLIDIARALEIPIVLTEQNPQKLGPFVSELADKMPGVVAFGKHQFGCFENEAIARAIAATGRKSIVLAGIESHICIFQTGAGALRRGYRVHVVSDAVSATSDANLDIGLKRLGHAGAVISSTEMVIFELLREAGTEEFRSVLPHIKKIVR